jgi:Protein of unknown function DUF262/Protein of unknown function (DUF1524)
MAATNFKTENNTFRKLMGNGLTYQIPRFQRDYSWTNEEWEGLWTDLLGTLGDNGETAHYMGYLVLQSTNDKDFDVIDGQQRLTTISLIVLAVLRNLQRLIDQGIGAEANQQRLNQIRQTYVGYLDPVSLLTRSKLTLNRNNDNYYQAYLVPLTKQLPQRGFRATEHLLRKAFEWFDKRVDDFIKASTGDAGSNLAKLIEDLSDRLFFTVITVTDELNAYKVFESLNARGVRLSATDLLKNYLFSVLDRNGDTEYELTKLEDRWESIVGRLQSENFPDFLRAHWNSRRSFARQADLFKTIRGQVNTPAAAFQLLRDMEEDLDTYLALSSPEPSNWAAEDKHLAGVLKTFRVRQPYPLLLAAKRVFDAADFTGLLRATVVITMRFNIIGSNSTAEQERKYNEVAERIAKHELQQLNPTLQSLRSIYPDDAIFRAGFAEKTIRTTDSRNKRVVRFILCALERHLSGQEYSFLSDTYDIEHVLAQNAPDGWGGFSHNDAEAMVYRLGNMTLLQASANRDLGTTDYSQKRVVYEQSNFAITQKLAQDNIEWTAAHIAAHQQWMATQATAIWRLSQLS